MTVKQYIIATVYDKKGRVISVGRNSYIKTHPMMHKLGTRLMLPEKIFLHAEIAALVKCRGIPYKIKIERYDKQGNPRLAKPCPICELAIQNAGIKFVEYTVSSV